MNNVLALCLLTAVAYTWQTAPHPSTAEMQVKKLSAWSNPRLADAGLW